MQPTMMINISDSHYQLWPTKVTNFCGIKPPRSIKFIDCFTSGGRTISETGRLAGLLGWYFGVCVCVVFQGGSPDACRHQQQDAVHCYGIVYVGIFSVFVMWIGVFEASIWLIKSSSHPSSSIICPMSGSRCPLPSLMLLGVHYVYITQVHTY